MTDARAYGYTSSDEPITEYAPVRPAVVPQSGANVDGRRPMS
jgi:hypothetical protein